MHHDQSVLVSASLEIQLSQTFYCFVMQFWLWHTFINGCFVLTQCSLQALQH